MKLRYLIFILVFNSCATKDTAQSKSLPVEEKQSNDLASQQQDQLDDVAMGVPCMGDYNPTPLPNYKFVPVKIRVSVEKNIVDQTGEPFFKQLRYVGGGFVNLDSLYAIEKEAKNYKWKPSSYYLCFELRDSAKGISYCSTIETDIRGNITKDIAFPDVARHPDKALLISKQAAIKVAVENKIFNTGQTEENGIYTEISLKFDDKRKIFLWEFERTFDTAGHASFDICYHNINAHNGKYLGYNLGSGIH
jgi:hypothetical protein